MEKVAKLTIQSYVQFPQRRLLCYQSPLNKPVSIISTFMRITYTREHHTLHLNQLASQVSWHRNLLFDQKLSLTNNTLSASDFPTTPGRQLISQDHFAFCLKTRRGVWHKVKRAGRLQFCSRQLKQTTTSVHKLSKIARSSL